MAIKFAPVKYIHTYISIASGEKICIEHKYTRPKAKRICEVCLCVANNHVAHKCELLLWAMCIFFYIGNKHIMDGA